MRCNQCAGDCDNKDCHKCNVCEFPLLCLCERTDKVFLDAKIKAHNSDYVKCFESLSKELYGNNPMRDYPREEVINIVRKHFA